MYKICQSELTRYSEATLADVFIPKNKISIIGEWIKNPKNFLIYLGDPGCGKTYFCHALFNYIKSKFSSGRFWNERIFMGHLRHSIETGGDYLRELEMLCDDFFMIYDDMGSIKMNDWREEVIFSLIDTRYTLKLPTVITSNLTKDQFHQKYEKRLCSRLFSEENIIIEVRGVDQRKNGY